MMNRKEMMELLQIAPEHIRLEIWGMLRDGARAGQVVRALNVRAKIVDAVHVWNDFYRCEPTNRAIEVSNKVILEK